VFSKNVEKKKCVLAQGIPRGGGNAELIGLAVGTGRNHESDKTGREDPPV